MTVVKHETNTRNKDDAFCYNSSQNTLQFSEEILNELETTKNNDIPKYKYYEDEMEKIHSGDLSNLNAVKLDEYFGNLGIDESSYKVIEKGGKYNGIC